MNSPIVLSASVSVSANQILEPETTRLQNPYKTAMLLEEIRFRMPFVLGAASAEWPPFLSVRAELRMGRLMMTNGFVPVGNLCRRTIEENGDSLGNANVWHTWKLAKPLYVPKGEFVIPRIQLDPRYGSPTSAMPIQVSYAGRSLPVDCPVPRSISLPWATHFDIPKLAYSSGNTDSTISTPGQLVNPFEKSIFVQRFIGRTLRQSSETILGNTVNELGFFTGDSIPASTQTVVRAVDSFGNILVRDPTPFTHLFQFLDRSWTVNSMLSPKGFYIFTVDRNYTATVANLTFAHAISMVGYREVELQ